MLCEFWFLDFRSDQFCKEMDDCRLHRCNLSHRRSSKSPIGQFDQINLICFHRSTIGAISDARELVGRSLQRTTDITKALTVLFRCRCCTFLLFDITGIHRIDFQESQGFCSVCTGDSGDRGHSLLPRILKEGFNRDTSDASGVGLP